MQDFNENHYMRIFIGIFMILSTLFTVKRVFKEVALPPTEVRGSSTLEFRARIPLLSAGVCFWLLWTLQAQYQDEEVRTKRYIF
jgi:hypothetical protein